MTLSLHRRLLWLGIGVVVAFVVLAGAALDAAFRNSALDAQRDRLQGHVYTLLASSDVTPDRITVDGVLPEPRFSQPQSGLYAWLVGPDRKVLWASPSVLGTDLKPSAFIQPGQSEFTQTGHAFVFAYGVSWQLPGGVTRRFTIVVREDARAFDEQLAAFRRTLWGWLLAGAAALIAALWVVMRWLLSPLRRVERDLDRMDRGDLTRLPDDYPQEILRLTTSINGLIQRERERGERFRRNLDDLAHSLKTPLAVLRGLIPATPTDKSREAEDQIERIGASLDYYVRRGGAGMASTGDHTPVAAVIDRLVKALRRAHPESASEVIVDCASDVEFPGSEGDLMELLGNLLDNAFKWARARITVAVTRTDRGLVMIVGDDGPGIDAGVRTRVTKRGVRADSRTPGEGIGLAVVSDIVSAYGGEMTIGTSSAGGAELRVTV